MSPGLSPISVAITVACASFIACTVARPMPPAAPVTTATTLSSAIVIARSFDLLRGPAAVDHQFRTRHVAAVGAGEEEGGRRQFRRIDRKSTRLNSSH